MIADAGLVSLRPNRVDGWLINENAGYYIHQGRVYLQGEVSTLEGVTASIFTGIPSRVCPATDQHFTLYADLPTGTEDALDPALVLPNTYAATMHPNGLFSLDAPPPPQLVSPPGGTYIDDSHVIQPRYTEVMALLLSLPGVSWALEDDTDDYTPISFAPYMVGADFTNIDATIFKHGSRVHLDGHVTANFDRAIWLSRDLPTAYQPATGVDGVEAVINAQDPRIHRIGDVEHNTIGFNNDQPVLPNPDVEVPDAFPYLTSGPASRAHGIFRVGNVVQANTVHYENTDSVTCPIYDLVCNPAGLDTESPAISDVSGAATGSVAALLANFDPLPDWIMVSVAIDFSGLGGFGGCYPCSDETGYRGGGCIFHEDSEAVHIAAPGALFNSLGDPVAADVTADHTIPREASIGNGAHPSDPPVFVARGSVAYTGAPDDWRSILLWRPGEIDLIDFSWDGAMSGGGARWILHINPYWERRRAFFQEGDVLDLTGCGWHLTAAQPRAGPGELRAIPGPGGLRPRGQSKMVRP